MSLHLMLQQQLGCAQALLQRAEQLFQGVEGHQKLCGKVRAELRFLRRVESGELQVKESHLHSTNLTHLTAVVESAESLEGVVSLLHVFSYQDAAGARHSLVVDVVASGGHTWVKAVGRKAKALHNIWQGRGQYGDKSIIGQAEDFLQASQQQPVQYRHPHIIFAFYNGVSSPMADRLREMGISVRGDIVAVNTVTAQEGRDEALEEEELCEEEEEAAARAELTRVDRGTVVASLAFPAPLQVEECPRVNLDITTLITYVSSLSHGRCHLRFREPVLTEQAAQERQQPVLPRLDAFMQGKELFACRAAVHDFQVILDTLGGPGEKERAQKLLARLRLVDDQPSERSTAAQAHRQGQPALAPDLRHRGLAESRYRDGKQPLPQGSGQSGSPIQRVRPSAQSADGGQRVEGHARLTGPSCLPGRRPVCPQS
ncbi:unnamed protein product [Tetraodon nigroviridis]|uniref:(spotted green pufferfish) hypothetical protein n=1 Tax=Tetraodon nigroviridis TaxID=99883 RepID=Q4T9Z9_TETNG|nr:unnamed protein product [Tetraodon nigroviridis]